jgi:hypothetical protein
MRMMSRTSGTALRCMRAAAIALTVIACASPAGAQYDNPQWQHRKKNPNPGPPQIAPRPHGGAICVPSGFARLSRNCNVNTGGCQPMRESCNLGWCCP